MIEAKDNGCDQVCFLDAAQGRYVEELGGMNIFFVYADGRLVTPELTGTILEGVTRSSILQLGKELGHEVEERKVEIEEWRAGVADGSLREVFACGTAAVVTPVGRLAVGRRRARHGRRRHRAGDRGHPLRPAGDPARRARPTRTAGCTSSPDPRALPPRAVPLLR